MNILLVYPKYPETFWSYSKVLPFVSKKAAVPPLGLITVSAMLPKTWNKKLVDMNVSELTDEDIDWANYVFISAMYVQQESVGQVVDSCVKRNTKIVAGGPYFSHEYHDYPGVDHFVLNEAEITLPPFLADLESNEEPKRVYKSSDYAVMADSPVPDFHLLSMKDYVLMSLQVSRGCPFACDFCEITSLLGHKVRIKSSQQVIAEMEALNKLKWKGQVSVVDDNFIGNKRFLKNDLLPAMTEWNQQRKYPFAFNIQASIDLADDMDLLKQLVNTGFNSAFIGIETPDAKSLNECNKVQNKNRNLLDSVHKIQKYGMQVSGGFIVGFDSDSPSVFTNQMEFIQESGIVSAMVGILNAPKNTNLYNRMEAENRITDETTGSNTDITTNILPKMGKEELFKGFTELITNIYSAKPYYKRVRKYLLNYNKLHARKARFDKTYVKAFFKSIVILGVLSKSRGEYWKLLVWTLFSRPRFLVDAFGFTVYGYHYRSVYGLKL